MSTFWNALFGCWNIVRSSALYLEICYVNVRKSLLYLGNQALGLRIPQDNKHMLMIGSATHCTCWPRGDARRWRPCSCKLERILIELLKLDSSKRRGQLKQRGFNLSHGYSPTYVNTLSRNNNVP